MSTTRELCEAEISAVAHYQGDGTEQIQRRYEEITDTTLPTAVIMAAVIPDVLDRCVQDTEAAATLKEFLPAPEVISTLGPQEAGERLLLFFEKMIAKKQHRTAIMRDYIGGTYPVKRYPADLQAPITKTLLEGWDWLANQGLIVQENKQKSFVISRNGETYLKKMKEKEGRFIIFYSWQSDLPRNRGFIEDCIKEAIAQLSGAADVVVVPSIDRDTQGEPGSPAIADTIFSKIDNCDMFVCDISIINTDENPKRPTPNPNVLLELGWAAKRLGWERITSVFNLAHGKIEDLPFDLKQRRVVKFSLEPGEIKTTAMKSLVNALVLQINAVVAMRQRR